MHINPTASKNPATQRTALTAGVFVLAAVLAWTQWHALASTRDTHRQGLAQLETMRADADQIALLRRAPQTVAGQTRTSQELLVQVAAALGAAGIDRALWNDSVPEPTVRLPQSDYRRVGTRMYLTSLTLQQLAAFVHHLESHDATLHVTAINLTNRERESALFDVDLVLRHRCFEELYWAFL